MNKIEKIELVTSETVCWQTLLVNGEPVMEGFQLETADVLHWLTNELRIDFEEIFIDQE